MVDILKNIMNIAYRVRDMQIAGTLSMVLFGAVLVFGIMNCVLGYRLLRFWMMILDFSLEQESDYLPFIRSDSGKRCIMQWE